ncbi:MAG TPA: NAD-dependent epimerase/dehydratase family protein [Planctomycetota bacterium]|jgi:2'-hydroxyisoflavone reductase|nr:NAD-dependent epimerase/dehydratase family protein [Planctomycetota bacterium]
MSTTRREFLGQTVVLGSAAAVSFSPKWSPLARPLVGPKRILILGGTGFIGPKTVEAALARGHKVTVFNRGHREKYRPLAFKDVEHLYGNRDPELPADDEKGADGKLLHPDAKPKGLEELVGKEWDAVIDNSGYFPRMVAASAQLLAKSAKQYIFISSISAYASMSQANADEDAPLAKLADPKTEEMGKDFGNYGGLKVLCEQAAAAAFPGRAAIVRPGYIVGPGDPTDRFSYWPVRISRGGEALIPGSPDDPIQYIDARDLAEWLVKMVEDGTSGTFNAIGPAGRGRWGDVITACAAATKTPAKLTWVPTEWLEKNGMGGEDAFPIWAPPTGEFAGSHTWKNERAIKAGLKFRSAPDTVKGILEWWPSELEARARITKELTDAAVAKKQDPPKLPDPTKLKAGPKPEREAELLAAWNAESAKK